MKEARKKTVNLIFVAVLLFGVVALSWAAGKEEAPTATGTEPITFTWLRTSWPTWDEPMSADAMGQWMIEQTGVTLEIEQISGEASERYNLVLATQDFPDLMSYPGDALLPKFIDEGAIVKLDEYLDQYPNIYEQFQEAWGVYTNIDDGHIYALPTWYSGKFVASAGTDIRHDIMMDYFPDRADVKAIFTLDEIYEMLVDYKSKNPVTKDGVRFIGWTNTAAQGNAMRQIWNNSQELYLVDENTVAMQMFNPNEREMVIFLNKMYREGFLDPDMFLNTYDQMNAKLSNESAIIANVHQARYSAVNAMMHEQDENKYFAYYRVVADLSEPNGYYAHGPFGVPGTVIMTEGKDIERLLSFINFTTDKYVNFYLCNGRPGTFYDVVDDRAVPNIEAISAIDDLWTRFRQVGAYKYVGWLREGIDTRLTDIGFWYKNASLGSLIHYSWDAALDYSQNHRIINWTEKEELANPGYMLGIAVGSDTPEGIIKQRIDDIYLEAFAKAVMARTEAQAIQIYEEALADINAAGYEQYIKAMTPRYLARKAFIDEMGEGMTGGMGR